MVGLSIVLEAYQKGSSGVSKKIPQVINKATMVINKPPSPSSSKNSQFCSTVPSFLQQCFLCGQKLLPCKDIYMYKGDRAFCSEECRCRQIFMDEEETLKKQHCSFVAASTSSSPSSTSTSASRHRKSTRNREGGFAY
ncbi:hypothetical protein Tsubulata_051016 [Turnera subulata]|uniref:FLZ-type domain-containing protein n=1 Tax=Turnera subulata TaxID=218843 RepID=A0A9Q0G276_9ROSI|nr:hypothetical protein Tsubulata_051016 [Turnera subulata]